MPLSIRTTISNESPEYNSTEETCKNWLETYNNHIYRKSVFFKGPLLYISDNIYSKLDPATVNSLNSFKNNLKKELLNVQSSGIQNEWLSENLHLYNLSGLRKSNKKTNIVKYTNMF